MKVLHVNEHLAARGGIETYLLSLIPRLEEAGYAQSVVYASGDAALVERSRALEGLSSGRRGDEEECYRRMREVISQERPEVVHLHNIRNRGGLRACLESAPVVFTGHDYRYVCPASSYFHKRTRTICEATCGPMCFVTTVSRRCLSRRPRNAWSDYRRVRWVVQHAERFGRVIAPSRGAAERFVRAGFSRERVEVLPYFCPLEPLAEPRERPERPTLLFIGRFAENKGYEEFVRALGLLPEPVRGLMIGNLTAEREREIRGLANSSGCEARLELRDWVGREAIAEVMSSATVLAFPSLWSETLGIVGLEALACGVPVVASDVGGVREWLREGATGYLVQPKSPGEIAEAAMRILDDPDHAEELGRAGIRLMREKFSPERHVERLVEIYREVSESAALAAGVQTFLSAAVS